MIQSPVALTTSFSCTVLLLVSLICMPGCLDGRSAKQIDVGDRHQIKSSTFIGTDNAWLVTANQGNLVMTKNAGQDWSTVPGDRVGGKFESVGFVDDKRGLAVNKEGQIWRSSDGGQKWTEVAQLRSAKPSDWQFMSSDQIKFADELRAWIVETFTIWRTDDGGNTWRQVWSVLNPETDGQPGSFYSLNRNAAWVVTAHGRIYQTDDGGNDWQVVHLMNNVSVIDVFFVNQHTGWVLGFNARPPYAKLYRTVDAGKTWLPLTTPDSNVLIASINFVNEKEGWAAGRLWTGDRKTSAGALFHTVDGGESWRHVQLPQSEPFFGRVHFLDSQHGWLFSRDNVYRTDDSGKNWRIVLKLSPTMPREIAPA